MSQSNLQGWDFRNGEELGLARERVWGVLCSVFLRVAQEPAHQFSCR